MKESKMVIGKVVSQRLFFTEKGELAIVPSIEIEPDYAGEYYLRAINPNESVRNWRKSWSELKIDKIKDGIYHLSFFRFYNTGKDDLAPFLVIEMTKEQVCEWHRKDHWFQSECHYLVRRVGKKFHGSGDGKRCIKCRYLVEASATKCHRCEG